MRRLRLMLRLMRSEIWALEELSFRTLPAIEQERYDGWVLRWSNGGSRRGNSVNPMATSTIELDAKIAYCEAWLHERDVRPTFRLTDLAESGLDSALDATGYSRTSPTDVMTAPLAPLAPVARAQIETAPSREWLRAIPVHGEQGHYLPQLRSQLTGSAGAGWFASISVDDKIVAIGLGIVLDGWLTIYNMNTLEPHRRRGHAWRILQTLLAIGQDHGAQRAVLQVTQDNVAAQRLYRSAGFSPAYQYWYREAPVEPDDPAR